MDPIWSPIVEYPVRKVEIIQRPNTSSNKDMKFLLKNKFFTDPAKKAKVDFKRIDNIAKIHIEGKNLCK